MWVFFIIMLVAEGFAIDSSQPLSKADCETFSRLAQRAVVERTDVLVTKCIKIPGKEM